jgi:hypothetical protein
MACTTILSFLKDPKKILSAISRGRIGEIRLRLASIRTRAESIIHYLHGLAKHLCPSHEEPDYGLIREKLFTVS